MKKSLFVVLVMAFAMVSGVKAQTAEEQAAASKERIEKLKAESPKNCEVKEIDDAVAASKSIATSIVGIATVTQTLSGEAELDAAAVEAVKALPNNLKSSGEQMEKLAKLLPEATKALKTIKNPMKAKAAKKSLDYVNSVMDLASAELPYQTEVVNKMVSGK